MRPRTLRLGLLALVAIGLAPGTFVREATGARQDVAEVTITPVAHAAATGGPLRLTGAWELESEHGWFGGFSALVADGQRLIAGTDRGFLLDIDAGGAIPRAVPGSYRFVGSTWKMRKEIVDLEGLAHDPRSGMLWASFENFDAIKRFSPDESTRLVRPREMAGWNANGGPETFDRLADGSFLMIAEEREDDSPGRPALLWPGDPLEGAGPVAFRFAVDADYNPVDATQLPDGRVLILLRQVSYAIPVRFATAVAIADPRTIRAGATWQARVIWRLTAPGLKENYEGIAFVPDSADPARGNIWLIADDNFSLFQRNLLLRFGWQE